MSKKIFNATRQTKKRNVPRSTTVLKYSDPKTTGPGSSAVGEITKGEPAEEPPGSAPKESPDQPAAESPTVAPPKEPPSNVEITAEGTDAASAPDAATPVPDEPLANGSATAADGSPTTPVAPTASTKVAPVIVASNETTTALQKIATATTTIANTSKLAADIFFSKLHT